VAKAEVSVTMMLSPEAPHDTYGDDDGSCSINESLPINDGMFCRLSSISQIGDQITAQIPPPAHLPLPTRGKLGASSLTRVFSNCASSTCGGSTCGELCQPPHRLR
jgi:hypothetical protein